VLKIEACQLLITIAKQLANTADVVIGSFHYEILESIKAVKLDKTPAVQAASKAAAHEWDVLQRIHSELEERKMQPESSLPPEDLLKARMGIENFPRYALNRIPGEIPGASSRGATSSPKMRMPSGSHFHNIKRMI
jgi:hypothetical protein